MSIPADIRNEAIRMAAMPHITRREAIELAILAERKRCAKVARHLNGWGPVGGNVVAEHIAKVIELSAGWGVEK